MITGLTSKKSNARRHDYFSRRISRSEKRGIPSQHWISANPGKEIQRKNHKALQKDTLIGKPVICVTNFAPKQVANCLGKFWFLSCAS